ncbi:MAG: hypothetical protein ACE5LB_06790 [Acidiferrobacterales bacterium]
MNDSARTMKIRFTDGTEQNFEFPQQGPETNMAARIQEMVSSKVLMLELEDRVVVIPYQNIQSIDVLPAPSKLPSAALKGARRLK